MRAELNVMGLALEFLGGIFLASSILRFLFRAKSYVHDYQEAWNTFIASRPDLEEEAIRYHEGTLGVDIGGDLERALREKEFVRAKLRLLDWLVYVRAEEEKKFVRYGLIGVGLLGTGFALQIAAALTGTGSVPALFGDVAGPSLELAGASTIAFPEVWGTLDGRPKAALDPTDLANQQDHRDDLDLFGPVVVSLESLTGWYTKILDDQQSTPQETSQRRAERLAVDVRVAEGRIVRRLQQLAEEERSMRLTHWIGYAAIVSGFLVQMIRASW